MTKRPPQDRQITNTRAAVGEMAPVLTLFNLMTGELGKPSGYIENMEAEGQRELVSQTSRLPSAGILWSHQWGHAKPDADTLEKYPDIGEVPATRAAVEKMGIKVLGEDPQDPIWCQVELPPGWRIEATAHSMWSNLIDDRGYKRASIFYKAAFYDRSCHINLECRYDVGYGPKDDYEERICQYAVYDTAVPRLRPDDRGKVLFETEVVSRDDYAACQAIEVVARTYLKEHFPEYRDPAAYWETPVAYQETEE